MYSSTSRCAIVKFAFLHSSRMELTTKTMIWVIDSQCKEILMVKVSTFYVAVRFCRVTPTNIEGEPNWNHLEYTVKYPNNPYQQKLAWPTFNLWGYWHFKLKVLTSAVQINSGFMAFIEGEPCKFLAWKTLWVPNIPSKKKFAWLSLNESQNLDQKLLR